MAEFNYSGGASGAAAGSKFGPWGAVTGGVIGGFMGGGNDAAERAAAESLAFQRQMYEQQDPFSAGGNRAQYVPQLNELMRGGMSGIQGDPMYRQLQQGAAQGISRKMAAQGQGGSTNEMNLLYKTNMGIGMDYFSQQYNRLASLAGVNAGRTSPMQGISPEMAMRSENNRQSAIGGGFGMAMSGLEGIFGNPGEAPSSGPSGYTGAGFDNEYSGFYQD